MTIAELLSDRTRANDAEGIWRIVAPRHRVAGLLRQRVKSQNRAENGLNTSKNKVSW